jgi:hypothetical protein
MLSRMFSRLRELTVPKDQREAARAERRQRDNEKIATSREAVTRAESHSRHSGGFHQEWRG